MASNSAIIVIALLLYSFVFSSCNFSNSANSKSSDIAKKDIVQSVQKNSIDFKTSPKQGHSFTLGDNITFSFEIDSQYDSAKLVVAKNSYLFERGNSSITIKNNDLKLGRIAFEITIYKDGKESKKSSNINITPKQPTIKKAIIVNSLPHSKSSFTQGITFDNGRVYESSGGYGKSFIEVYEFPSMKTVKKVDLEEGIFAEGSTIIGNEFYVLSWRENRCLVFDKNTLQKIKEFKYNTEGWGLTTDSQWLYLSDGTQYIYKIDPKTFKYIDRIAVKTHRGEINYINELEWIEGYIYANVFTDDHIIKIDPQNGAVLEVFEAKNIYDNSKNDPSEDVLNGIMYDKTTKKTYITGKSWSKLFEVKLQ